MKTTYVRIRVLFILFCSVFMLRTATAQIPNTISYQGALSKNGVAISGQHLLHITLYDNLVGGSLLFEESHQANFTNGLFNITLGSSTPFPSSLVFDRTYFLALSIDGGEELSPRTPFTSAPYALNSHIAELARGLTGDAHGVVTSINELSGAVRIIGDSITKVVEKGNDLIIHAVSSGGSAGIQSVKSPDNTIVIANSVGPDVTIGVADNAITSAKLANGSVTPSKLNQAGATKGQILKWNGTAWVVANDSIGGNSTAYYAGSGIVIKNDTISTVPINSNDWLLTGNKNTTPTTNFLGTTDVNSLAIRTNNIERMRVDPLGNIGIGTTTPQQMLDIKNGSLLISNTGNAGSLMIASNGGANTTSITTTTQTANIIYQLPSAIGTKNQVLTIMNVIGNTASLDWTNVSGGGNDWLLTGNTGTTAGTNFLGTKDNQAVDIRANNTIQLRVRPDSVIQRDGGGNARGQYAVDLEIVRFGDNTQVASGFGSTISGGIVNAATGGNSTVTGGADNLASGMGATVGGILSVGSGMSSTVNGGYSNGASGNYSTISGGQSNGTSGNSSTIGGGALNIADGLVSTISGGESNKASGDHSTVSGGSHNVAQGSYSAIVGGRNLKVGNYDFGFNGDNSVSVTDISTFIGQAYFGNVNMMIGNVDNTARELRFFEPNNSLTYTGTNFSSIKAGTQSADILYTLPIAQPTTNQVLTATAITGTGPYNITLGWADNGSGNGSVIYGPTTLQATLTPRTTPLFNIAYLSTAANANAAGASITSSAGTAGNFNATGLTLTATGKGTGNTTGLLVSATGSTGTVRAIDATGRININLPSSYDIDGNHWLWMGPNTVGTVTMVGNTLNTTNTANDNTFVGAVAGMSNTDGNENTFVGSVAGTTNTTGNGSTFVGAGAGNSNISGSLNTFIGAAVGNSNISGDANTFVGVSSGWWNTTGQDNTFLGVYAGEHNSTGSNNTQIGASAGNANTTGHENVSIGYQTAIATTTAYANTMVGTSAGASVVSGSRYTLFGNASDASDNLTNATAIGSLAFVGASNSLILGAITGINGGTDTKVGIGTTTPSQKLNVENGNLLLSRSGANAPSQLQLQGTSTGLSTFASGAQGATTINYTLPTSQPTTNQVLSATAIAGTGPYNVTLGWATNGGSGFVNYGPTSVQATLTPRTTPLFNIAYLSTAADANAAGATITSSAGAAGNLNATALTLVATATGTGLPRALDATGRINIDNVSSYDISGNRWLWNGASHNATVTIVGNTGNSTNAGIENVFVGSNAGHTNTNGYQNTFLGSYTGYLNTTGAFNVFLGDQAGYSNTTAQFNTMVGSESGWQNTASSNTLIGSLTGWNLKTGATNTFVGVSTGYHDSSGSHNVMVGYNAGQYNFAGSNNTYLGDYSGTGDTVGTRNLLLGYIAIVATGHLSNAAAIGANSVVSASNSMVLGSINGVNNATSDVNVGIGTTAPLQKFNVGNGNILLSRTGTNAPSQLQLQGTSTGLSTFASGAQGTTSINYTLPISQPTANQVLSATAITGTGPYNVTLGWATSGSNAWNLTGNSGTTAGTNFIGTTDNQALDIRSNNNIVLRLNTNGSIQRDGAGNARGTSSIDLQNTRTTVSQVTSGNYEVLGGGQNNTVTGTNAVITGGESNTASGADAVIGGGGLNYISSTYSTIAGGYGDTIEFSTGSTIGGGFSNIVTGQSSVIAGGYANRNSGSASVISGGESNVITNAVDRATIGGGVYNWATGDRSVIAGGGPDTASGLISTISGGAVNVASGAYSTIAGGSYNSAVGTYSVISGGTNNYNEASLSSIVGGGHLRLTGTGSFAFHAGNNSTDSAFVNTNYTAYFGNVNMWLGNTNNIASQLRFYEAQNGGVKFPGASTNFTSFQAGVQSADIQYTLPTASPVASGNLLLATSGAASTMSWSTGLVWDNTNSRLGINTTTPSHPIHSIYSGTTDETAAVFGNSTGSTTNQSIGVWGDASNTGTSNTGTIGVLATGNGNATAGQTNIALQINDGEFTVGRTTEAPGTGTDVQAATGGTAYSAQGPSGVVELTLGGAGDLVTAAPTANTIQKLTTITVNNRYCQAGSIVLLNIVGMTDDGNAPDPRDAAFILNVDNTASGSFSVRVKMIPAVTNAANYAVNDKIQIGYVIVNKSK